MNKKRYIIWGIIFFILGFFVIFGNAFALTGATITETSTGLKFVAIDEGWIPICLYSSADDYIDYGQGSGSTGIEFLYENLEPYCDLKIIKTYTSQADYCGTHTYDESVSAVGVATDTWSLTDCITPVVGCMDETANNYDPDATEDEDPSLCTYDEPIVPPEIGVLTEYVYILTFLMGVFVLTLISTIYIIRKVL